MTTNNDDRDDNNKSTMPTITMTKNNGDAMNIQERTKKKKYEVCKVHLDDGTRTTTTARIGTTNDKTTHQNYIIHIHLPTTTTAIRIITTFEIRNKKAAYTF